MLLESREGLLSMFCLSCILCSEGCLQLPMLIEMSESMSMPKFLWLLPMLTLHLCCFLLLHLFVEDVALSIAPAIVEVLPLLHLGAPHVPVVVPPVDIPTP